MLGVRESAVFKVQELVERYGVKPRDAAHAAVALENKIKTILSYDEDFDAIDEIRRIESELSSSFRLRYIVIVGRINQVNMHSCRYFLQYSMSLNSICY